MFDSVLLIEDDPSHAMLVKRALREHIGEISHAVTIGEAVEMLKGWQISGKEPPQLIITDLQLPDTVGTRHIEVLKEAGGDIPILVLTSSTSLEDAIGALKLGAKDFIVKNFNSEFKEVFFLSLSRLFATVEIERERRKILKELALLRIAIENSNDGLAVILTDGTIAYSNGSFRSFIEFCGGEPGNILKGFSSKVHKRDALVQNLAKNLKELPPGSVWSVGITFVDDKERAFDLSLSVFTDPSDQTKRAEECVVWVKDMSEQRRRERFQREILSTTTHDLKGPLGAITISVDLLRNLVESGTKASELILRVGSSAQGAIDMIDELLSARRIQEGNYILKPLRQDVSPIIEEVVLNQQAVAGAKRIELRFESESQELLASVDKLGISRVIGNLLSNALKFTPKGGSVLISAFLRHGDLHIVVKDSGCGMEPSDVQKLFTKFSRLEQHREVSGTGLGLFVVKSIVSAHGGTIEVTSQVGAGTSFEISFPHDPPVNERGELVSLAFA